jgi:hypothetical protein
MLVSKFVNVVLFTLSRSATRVISTVVVARKRFKKFGPLNYFTELEDKHARSLPINEQDTQWLELMNDRFKRRHYRRLID